MSQFKESDIVVYEGAITTFSVLSCLVDKNNPDIRKATTEEVVRYIKRPETTPQP